MFRDANWETGFVVAIGAMNMLDKYIERFEYSPTHGGGQPGHNLKLQAI